LLLEEKAAVGIEDEAGEEEASAAFVGEPLGVGGLELGLGGLLGEAVKVDGRAGVELGFVLEQLGSGSALNLPGKS
jgi:hypothetical protein